MTMNLLGPTLVLYLLIGLAIAVALYLTDRPRPPTERALRLGTAVPFWPLYLPILLTRPTSVPLSSEDEWSRTLAVVERELDAALSTLNDWIGIAEEPRRRIEKLREAWTEQAERLREMDRLLSRPEFAAAEEKSPIAAAPEVRQSLVARQQNVERLRQVRRQAEADLLASLAWVREWASRIHLARFTDAPTSRAAELLAVLAAGLETLTASHGTAERVYSIKKAE
jgi:hypothetical protein